jgi:hypothetical protein
MRLSACLVVLVVLHPLAWAGQTSAPRTLPLEQAGVLQRLGIIGKKVKTRDRLSDGGKRVRSDLYKNVNGELQLQSTIVKGEHADGTKFTAIRKYTPLDQRMKLADAMKTIEDGLEAPTFFGALKKFVGAGMAMLRGADMTQQVTVSTDGTRTETMRIGFADKTLNQEAGKTVKSDKIVK